MACALPLKALLMKVIYFLNKYFKATLDNYLILKIIEAIL